MVSLSPAQQSLVDRPLEGRIFLEGPAGCGKTTVGVAWLSRLLQAGVPKNSILLLIPHRPLAEPYYQVLRALLPRTRGNATDRFDASDSPLVTIAGLAQRAVNRFWPAIAGPAGFASPRRPPVFINHETAQYVMALVARPLLAQGYFETITIKRNRLFSEIMDNLNRAAGAGFPYTEIAHRLKSAWTGDAAQLRVFDDLQECIIRFRQFCLTHNLLDFSLLLEVFAGRLWPDPQVQDALGSELHYLIADNLEEDVPVTHDILRQWLPRFASALLIYDHDAGYRLLLGADPQTAYALKDICDQTATLDESFVLGPETKAIVENLTAAGYQSDVGTLLVQPRRILAEAIATRDTAYLTPLASQPAFNISRFYPQMLDWVAAQVSALVYGQGYSPQDIAILTPNLTDAILFSLTDRLEREGIPVHSFRPSRPLSDEPVAQALLTLTALAHPGWFGPARKGELPRYEIPTRYDLAYALVQLIEGMDLVRAQLLADIVYRLRQGLPTLTSFSGIRSDMQERITLILGARYETLWSWLDEYRRHPPLELDEFWSRLLKEVLRTPGFRLATNQNARQAVENLIDSAGRFRQAVFEAMPALGVSSGGQPLALEFMRLTQEGIAPAQYLSGWRLAEEQAVLIASPYTFLFTNRPVEIQFWLDASSRAWAQRPYQPLTHPYVLSRSWPEQCKWNDEDEVNTARQALYRLILGLSRRCRRSIYVAASQLSEQGFEQTGPLLYWLQIGMPR